MPELIDIKLGNPYFGWLATFAIVATALNIYSVIAKRRAFVAFGVSGNKKSNHNTGWRTLTSTFFLVTAIVFFAIALMDIRWGKTAREVPQKGLEIVFALDVSRSMLAEDVSPNRLERAKQQINEMVEEMAGDRIGLVLFAGEAKQAVPLTSHYEDFRQILESAGPDSIRTGGSRLGIAIKTAADTFLNKTNDHKTIVLFTDGEDQESQPIETAKQLQKSNGTRVFTIGLGDIARGARIPETQRQTGSFVQHEGEQVWSKLNGQVLKAIAAETNAAYIPAGTKRVDMASVFHRYIANLPKSEFESATVNAYTPQFQWFGAIAFACLFIEAWLSTTRSRKSMAIQTTKLANQGNPEPQKPQARFIRKNNVAALTAILFAVVGSNIAVAQQPQNTALLIKEANQLLRQEKILEAIEAYNQIDQTDPNTEDLLNYNLAVAHFRNSDFQAAQSLFQTSAKSDDAMIAADSRYNLGNCQYALALANIEPSPVVAEKQLNLAVQSYRNSLRLDRKNTDARKNIQLAQRLINQIKNRQPQPEETQDDKSNQQDNQDENNEEDQQPKEDESPKGSAQQSQSRNSDSKDQQQDTGDKSEQKNGQDSAKPDDSDKAQNDSTSAPSPDEASEQTPNSNQGRGEAPKESKPPAESENSDGEPSKNPEGNTDARDSQTNKKRPQSKPKGTSQQPESPGDKQNQEKTNAPPDMKDGKLTASNENEASNTNELKKTGPPLQDDAMMTREEAMKLLQSVRDRDMLRRMLQERRKRSGRVQVEKDW